MNNRGVLFKSSVDTAEKNLLKFRQNCYLDDDEYIVLLVALENADWKIRKLSRIGDKFVEYFVSTCTQVFGETGAVAFSFQSGDFAESYGASFACAWYPMTKRVGKAVRLLRRHLVRSRMQSRVPCYIAVSRTEDDAFRRLRMAGRNEVVIDPSLIAFVPETLGLKLDTIPAMISDFDKMIPFDTLGRSAKKHTRLKSV